ncbi:MAG TPA: hypothetical protein VGF59_20825 [Bryobacteraceae bacterium]|jgi:hypothetical protein
MPGYLDQYGVGEERREKIVKTIVIAVVALAVLGGVLFFIFHNYAEERQAKRFVESLEARDYKGAYALWGCTDEHPCRDYPFDKFMSDWGPQGQHADLSGFRISRSRSCGSGVILTVDFSKGPEEKLWVERKDHVIGYSPFPGCPAR